MDLLGPETSKLNIDATLVRLPLLFDLDVAKDLSKLMDLEVRLAVSRFPHVPQRNSSAEILGLSPLFHGLGYFPQLQKFDLHIVMNRLTALTDPHIVHEVAQRKPSAFLYEGPPPLCPEKSLRRVIRNLGDGNTIQYRVPCLRIV